MKVTIHTPVGQPNDAFEQPLTLGGSIPTYSHDRIAHALSRGCKVTLEPTDADQRPTNPPVFKPRTRKHIVGGL